ncbi:Bsp6I family type II restriction endonuclease [Candidatus Pacearchaeota archaeon]|nr:Bsp6I family type II restriction endonuclease [Candidatus Pacearchaeota archaeon]
MKIDWKDYQINGEKIKALVSIHEKGDKDVLRKLYTDWKKVSDGIKAISTRALNIPETITENAFCLFFPNCVRIVMQKGKKCAFDCLNIKTGEKIQIKAASIYPDATSFSPSSDYDKVYFLDFSAGDGSFKVYDIPLELIKKTIVNNKKGETFEDQQKQGRRPRFSITKEIILKQGFKPVKSCKL